VSEDISTNFKALCSDLKEVGSLRGAECGALSRAGSMTHNNGAQLSTESLLSQTYYSFSTAFQQKIDSLRPV